MAIEKGVPVTSNVTTVSTVRGGFAPDLLLYSAHVSAGFGMPGDDSIERELNVHQYLVDHPTSTFFVRVSGDSMEGERIFSDDILVVDRSITPQHGAIVVAAVCGELVVKRLSIQRGKLSLHSAQEGYQPIDIAENEDCYIWGVVTGSVRKL